MNGPPTEIPPSQMTDAELQLEVARRRCEREGHQDYETLQELGHAWPTRLICRCGAIARVTPL